MTCLKFSKVLRSGFLTILLFPVVMAELYGDCLRSTYSKKFICKPGFGPILPFQNWSTPVCPKQSLTFIGDSLMIEQKNVFSCLCPSNKVEFLGAKGTKLPLSKVLHEHGKMFHKDSIIVLNFGLWFNVNNHKRYRKEVHKVRRELHNLERSHNLANVVFVTTTAQHFCSKGGVYTGQNSPKCCDVKHLNTFRQDYAMEFLIEPLHLTYFNAFNITKNWFGAHPSEKGDCTHLCSNDNGPLIRFGLEFLSFIQHAQI